MGVATPFESRPIINYILGGPPVPIKTPTEEAYESSHGQSPQVNIVHTRGSWEETKPDDPISFLPINPNRVIVLHYDPLVLTLCINGFDVHMVLVDPGSATDLLQLLAFNKMKLSS